MAEPSDVPTAASFPSRDSSKHAPGASSNRRYLHGGAAAASGRAESSGPLAEHDGCN